MSFFSLFKKVNISYGITVCNEAEELDSLLTFLTNYLDKEDEVIVLQDVTARNVEVEAVIEKFKTRIVHKEAFLNGDFASFKNELIKSATKDYLFQIDADEIPQENLMKSIKDVLKKKSSFDMFFIPRINTVDGITEEHMMKWNWNINDKSYINYPDYQMRLFKLNKNIHWVNKVHEKLIGFEKAFYFPTENFDHCLLHHKNIDRQVTQNKFYDAL
ncbi:glycosyltransferase [Chryseobacterium lineare]